MKSIVYWNRKRLFHREAKIEQMPLTKDKLMTVVDSLPSEFSIDDLLEKLIVVQKIEEGLKQSANKQVLSTEEAKKKLKKWLK